MLTNRIAIMTTAEIEAGIVEIASRAMSAEVGSVRAALCDAYEMRAGSDALDALFDRIGA
jgi:hypothetical protein